jgi:selenide,water dikinase
VGDCATLEEFPETPKAGVYAVRQAPVLWHNLLAAAAGRTGRIYSPQSQFLSILNTADGRALLYYKGFVSHSRWAWRLKNWIDRRFMAKYQQLAEGESGNFPRPSSPARGPLHP